MGHDGRLINGPWPFEQIAIPQGQYSISANNKGSGETAWAFADRLSDKYLLSWASSIILSIGHNCGTHFMEESLVFVCLETIWWISMNLDISLSIFNQL